MVTARDRIVQHEEEQDKMQNFMHFLFQHLNQPSASLHRYSFRNKISIFFLILKKPFEMKWLKGYSLGLLALIIFASGVRLPLLQKLTKPTYNGPGCIERLHDSVTVFI